MKTQKAARQHRLTGSQRGDTIVEVLISLAIIGMVITGAFVVSRVNSQNVRTSEEHTEALQLLQGQVELLRSAASVSGNGLSTHADGFCMSQSATILTGSGCTVNTLYTLSIARSSALTDAPANFNGNITFDASVQWPALDGTTNTESLVYRLPVST